MSIETMEEYVIKVSAPGQRPEHKGMVADRTQALKAARACRGRGKTVELYCWNGDCWLVDSWWIAWALYSESSRNGAGVER